MVRPYPWCITADQERVVAQAFDEWLAVQVPDVRDVVNIHIVQVLEHLKRAHNLVGDVQAKALVAVAYLEVLEEMKR